MTTSPLPDAAPSNWVDRHAPVAWRPWLKLGRFDRPAGIWLLMLPGWQGITLAATERGQWPSPWLLLAFALGATLMRAAGCAFNDIVDRDIDAKVARTAARPVASGQISIGQAWSFIVLCALVSCAILVWLGPLAIELGVGSLALVAAYPFMKRITWWPQAWLGLTFNWGALMGYAAATGRLDAAAGLLYLSGVAWTLGYDTIYALQDLEDDAMVGVKSSARRLGESAPQGVAVFYFAAIMFALTAGAYGGAGLLFLPLLVLYAVHLLGQVWRLKVDDPAEALELFKSNRDAGLILLLALLAGHWEAPTLPVRPGPVITDRPAFILANTRPQRPPHTPEIVLHLADEVTPLWRLTEEELGEIGLPPPFWAFAWAGGQALARYLLDHPAEVAGKRVLDFAAGSGLVGIAALKAGAGGALCADIDGFCAAAVALNAQANGVVLDFTDRDLLDAPPPDVDVIAAGDICYEKPLAERVMAWLGQAHARGTRILIGDPRRSYFPRTGLIKLAEYQVPTTRELEDMEVKKTAVWTLP